VKVEVKKGHTDVGIIEKKVKKEITGAHGTTKIERKVEVKIEAPKPL
jgi:hypothetical protein